MGCQGCENCNSCTSCQNCNSCQVSCTTAQTICVVEYQTVSQDVGAFYWSDTANGINGDDTCVSSGEYIISAAAWNKLISYINNAYARGNNVNGGTPECKNDKVSSRDLFTADLFNHVSNALYGLGGASGTHTKVTTDSIVYGSYFSNLETAANTLKYTTSQCDSCNTGCQGCNACQGCDTCESGNSSPCGDCCEPVEETE